jgi:hypothetical protein
MNLKLARDDDGRPRAEPVEPSPRSRLLARFLELDVVDPDHARHLIDAARRGSGPTHRCSGNAYELAIGPRRTLIRAQVEPRTGPAAIALPTADFLPLLRRWLRLLDD